MSENMQTFALLHRNTRVKPRFSIQTGVCVSCDYQWTAFTKATLPKASPVTELKVQASLVDQSLNPFRHPPFSLIAEGFEGRSGST